MLKKNENMKYLIKNGRVIDPLNKIDAISDILVGNGRIEKIDKGLSDKSARIIDAESMIVSPGFVDMHAHLREPGREDEETISSGARSAVRGGYTSLSAMPNTEPAIDNPDTVKALRSIIEKDALCNVFIIGAITKSRSGKILADFKSMHKEGVVGVSDDGASVDDENLMKEALLEAKKNGLVVIEHCEDAKLSRGGVINGGFMATKMGLRGVSRQSEYERVRRDLALAKKTDSRIHIAHVSCRESVELIKKARDEGVHVTAETAPHYFTLTEDCCSTYDTNTKMNPPLKAKEDVEAIKKGLSDGTIDAIATDHAPHTDSEKDVEFDFAPFGIIGLETSLSLAVMELIDKEVISWPELILKMSASPAGILGIARGSLKVGSPADIVVIDPGREYIYKKDMIESRSKNSPFIDWKLKAKAVHVFVSGDLVMKDEIME